MCHAQNAYHCGNVEHVTKVRPAGMIFGYVGKMSEVIGVLTGTVNISNFVVANRLLHMVGKKRRLNLNTTSTLIVHKQK